MELVNIDIKPIEKKLLKIDAIFGKLFLSIDKDLINSLEYGIYYMRSDMADIYRLYARNNHTLDVEKARLHLQEREKHSSDLTTTKSVNKILMNEVAIVSLQERVVERLEKKEKLIIRLADHVNNMRIGELADLKRTQNH